MSKVSINQLINVLATKSSRTMHNPLNLWPSKKPKTIFIAKNYNFLYFPKLVIESQARPTLKIEWGKLVESQYSENNFLRKYIPS